MPRILDRLGTLLLIATLAGLIYVTYAAYAEIAAECWEMPE